MAISPSENPLVYGSIRTIPRCLTVSLTSDAHHLINSIKKNKCSIDWEGQKYLGLTLCWNYAENYIDISMPVYIPTALQKFHHKILLHAQISHIHGKKLFMENTYNWQLKKNSAPKLNSAYTICVQSIKITLLCCSCEVDQTMLPDINHIST